MAELKIDIDGINNKVIPKLNKAIEELETAGNDLFAINYSPVYYEFPNRARVQSVLPQNIINIKTDVNNIKNWLSDISIKFKLADQKSSDVVNSLLGKMDKINFSSNIRKTSNVKDRVTKQNMEIGPKNITTFSKKEFEFSIDIGSVHQYEFENQLYLTNAEVLDKSNTNNKKNSKFLDDPEIKEGLEQLNAPLELSKGILEKNATEILNKLNLNYSPQIKNFGENFFKTRDIKNSSGIEEGIVCLQRELRILELYFPDNSTILDGYYDSNITKLNQQLRSDMSWDEEQWKSMLEYMKKNNLTWRDIISEYENAISELTAYNEQLIENKSAIYSLERYIDLYPYKKITEMEDFKEYLDRDYSNVHVADKISQVISQVVCFITGGLVQIAVEGEDFNELTQEEKAIYFYLKENYNDSDAIEFYKSLEDIINQRKGMKDALNYVKGLDLTGLDTVDGLTNFLHTTGVGVIDGVWSFEEGLSNLFPENGKIMSELQYKQAILTSMLTQEINLDEIAKNYGKDSEEYKLYEKLHKMQDIYRKALGVNYNVASSIGSEAIPIAVSYIPYVGKPLGIALSSLSDAGNAKATAYQSGVTEWEAYLYAGIRGISSAVITKKLGAIPGLSDNASTTFKGIIKGSVQARTFCCCSAENRFIYS